MPDDHLLNAAHIIADAHELLGRPVLAKGIALLLPAEAESRRSRSAELPARPAFDDDPEPLPPRMIAADATIEKLADLMMGSPGLSLVRDELSGWLLNMTRYNTGTDRQFFLECWSGGCYPVDRIKRGSQIVDDLYLNVCGTIQPKTAAAVFGTGSADGNGNDGFLDRFGLIAYPEAVAWQLVDRWPDSTKRRALREACERLGTPTGTPCCARRPMTTSRMPASRPRLRIGSTPG